MPGPQVTVEVANHRFARRRFRDLPTALHPDRSPRLADDSGRFKARRDPWFAAGGRMAPLLARVSGSPAPIGRCTAHHVEGGTEGWFGFLDTVDDEEEGGAAVVALVEWAGRLLKDEGCTSLTGPASYTVSQEAGVQEGDADEVTGRPRTPPWLGPALLEAGLEPGAARPTWRLPAAAGPVGLQAAPGLVRRIPRRLRKWSDARLLLADPAIGRVVALPDVAGPWRAAGGPLPLAARAARREWATAVVLELDGDPAALVPALIAAAGTAGYTDVVSPWAPADAGAPEAVHRLYTRSL